MVNIYTFTPSPVIWSDRGGSYRPYSVARNMVWACMSFSYNIMLGEFGMDISIYDYTWETYVSSRQSSFLRGVWSGVLYAITCFNNAEQQSYLYALLVGWSVIGSDLVNSNSFFRLRMSLHRTKLRHWICIWEERHPVMMSSRSYSSSDVTLSARILMLVGSMLNVPLRVIHEHRGRKAGH